MPTCCVPNCRSGYKDGPKCSLFSVPKNPIRLSDWQKAIPRPHRPIQAIRDHVCEYHFPPECLIKYFAVSLKNGDTLNMKRGYVRLKANAVPSIFSNYPINPTILEKPESPNSSQQFEIASTTEKNEEIEISEIKLSPNSYKITDISSEEILTSEDSAFVVPASTLEVNVLSYVSMLNLPSHWTCERVGNFAVFHDWNSFDPASGNFTKRIVMDSNLNVKVFVGLVRLNVAGYEVLNGIQDIEKLIPIIEEMPICAHSSINSKCYGYRSKSSSLCNQCSLVLRREIKKKEKQETKKKTRR